MVKALRRSAFVNARDARTPGDLSHGDRADLAQSPPLEEGGATRDDGDQERSDKRASNPIRAQEGCAYAANGREAQAEGQQGARPWLHPAPISRADQLVADIHPVRENGQEAVYRPMAIGLGVCRGAP